MPGAVQLYLSAALEQEKKVIFKTSDFRLTLTHLASTSGKNTRLYFSVTNQTII